MNKTQKTLQDLAMKIQSVLWELEGYEESDVDTPLTDPRAAGGLSTALESIEQVERSKLRVREAEQAAKRASKELAHQVHPVLAMLYSELSTAEFAAKGALQAHQVQAIAPLVRNGYEQAHNKCYQTLKDAWTELQTAAHATH